MVCRLVQNDDIGTRNHHFREHTTDLLSSGKDIDLLHAVIPLKEHSAKITADKLGILVRGILGKPLYNGVFGIEFLTIVLWKIGLAGCQSPLIISGIRLHFSGNNLHEYRLCKLVRAYKSHLIGTV